MSVHLDTLFFSVCIVGFSGTPVYIRHRRQIDPPEHRNSSCHDRHAREHLKNTHVETNAANTVLCLRLTNTLLPQPQTFSFLSRQQPPDRCPPENNTQSQITIHPSLMCCLTRIHDICEEFTDQTFKILELSYQADHVRLLGFIRDGHQMSFLLVTPHKGHVKVHDICVIIVITDAVVLPPARVRSALRSWRKKTLINKHLQ